MPQESQDAVPRWLHAKTSYPVFSGDSRERKARCFIEYFKRSILHTRYRRTYIRLISAASTYIQRFFGAEINVIAKKTATSHLYVLSLACLSLFWTKETCLGRQRNTLSDSVLGLSHFHMHEPFSPCHLYNSSHRYDRYPPKGIPIMRAPVPPDEANIPSWSIFRHKTGKRQKQSVNHRMKHH